LTDRDARRQSAWRQLLGVWSHLTSRRRRWQLGALLLVMLASGLAEVVSLASVLPLLAVLTEPQRLWQMPLVQPLATLVGIRAPGGLLLPVTVIFGVAVVLAAAVRLCNLWLNGRLAAAIGSDLSCEVYRHTLYQPYGFHVQQNSSTLINTITGQVGNTVTAIYSALQLASSSLVALSLLLALLAIDAQIACLAAALFGLAYAVLAISTRSRLTANGAIVTEASRQVIKALQEGLGAIRDVLLDRSQPAYLAIYRSSDRPMRLRQIENIYLGSFPRFALEALGLLLIAVLALLLSWQRGHEKTVIPLLGTLALGAQRLLPALQQVYSNWTSIRALTASVADVLSMLEQPLPSDCLQSVAEPLVFRRSVRLRQLSFRYSDSASLVLNSIDLEIRHGERLGIIGATGSGKSTLMDVLMGLLQPTSGVIQVDGADLHDPSDAYTLAGWQAAVAHVPQSIYLADSSIAENIAFGVPRAQIDMSRVLRAAEQAQIAAFVDSSSDGYSSFVGERGIRLSGGQRQRIGIARALYKRASVLVFDEATSALDNATEEAVMESIDKLSRDLTIVMVAHRLSTIARCDRVIELQHGLIVRETSGDVAAART